MHAASCLWRQLGCCTSSLQASPLQGAGWGWRVQAGTRARTRVEATPAPAPCAAVENTPPSVSPGKLGNAPLGSDMLLARTKACSSLISMPAWTVTCSTSRGSRCRSPAAAAGAACLPAWDPHAAVVDCGRGVSGALTAWACLVAGGVHGRRLLQAAQVHEVSAGRCVACRAGKGGRVVQPASAGPHTAVRAG